MIYPANNYAWGNKSIKLTLKLIKNAGKKQNDLKSIPAASTSQPANTVNEASTEERCSYNVPSSNKFDTLVNKEVIDSSLPEPNPENPKNDSDPKSKTSEKKHNHDKPVQTIILCDSNGQYLNLTLLCPDSPTQYVNVQP